MEDAVHHDPIHLQRRKAEQHIVYTTNTSQAICVHILCKADHESIGTVVRMPFQATDLNKRLDKFHHMLCDHQE
jgi:hypothetical protein